MPALMEPPPYSQVEAVTEVLHGVPVTDPYRWLEDQDSARTREWLSAQTRYARPISILSQTESACENAIRQLLDVETYDSLQKVGARYFFRKRVAGQEQPCICFREGRDGADEVLVDPALRGTGPHTAVKPLRISPSGRLILYEVKQGGERTGTFELLNIETRKTLPDILPRGYLRGFAFAPDSQSFFYVHEGLQSKRPHYRAAYKHVLGTDFADDKEVFFAGEGENLRLHIVSGAQHLGLLVVRFEQHTLTDFYCRSFEDTEDPEPVIRNADYMFGPLLLKDGRILAITDREAPNFRVVEIRRRIGLEPEFIDVVPCGDQPIQNWSVCGDRVFVSRLRERQTEIEVFDLSGKPLGCVLANKYDTVRLLGSSEDGDELFFEQESFTKPVQTCTYLPAKSEATLWAERKVPFDPGGFSHTQVWFPARDGTRIPMFLVGRRNVLDGGVHPTIMTSYGGYGVPMTPQFSVFVAFLIERGCLFALPNIRGGSEFGAEWHNAAKRRNRQVAFDDFIFAAEWLIQSGRTDPDKLAIFGGSNSGLLVGAAMTQRPDLFRAVVCMVPCSTCCGITYSITRMCGKTSSGLPRILKTLQRSSNYSPYHNVRDGTAYPATMIVSGDSDQNCNPLHARKMTARLQAANAFRSSDISRLQPSSRAFPGVASERTG